MTNQAFIVTLYRGPFRDLQADVRREGAVLQSQKPQTYYRVQVVHMNEAVLEVSRLARRPQNLKYTPEIVTVDELCKTLDEARDVYEARQRKAAAAEQPPIGTEPQQDAADRSPDGSGAGPSGHLQAILDYMSRCGSLFGPAGKGQKTALILLLLRRGLGPDETVAVMQELDAFWNGNGKWTTTKGTVTQRRRGLRINGWEMDTCLKYRVPAV